MPTVDTPTTVADRLRLAQMILPEVATWVFFVVTWISPFALDSRAPQVCMALLIMEFVTMHATTFLIGFAGTRIGVLIGLVYVPFVIAATAMVKSYWPVVLFGGHLYATISALWSSAETRKVDLIARWAVSFGLFIVCIIVTAIIPWPGWGWNETTVPDMAWGNDRGESVYHVTPVWGVLYYASTVWSIVWLKHRRAARLWPWK